MKGGISVEMTVPAKCKKRRHCVVCGSNVGPLFVFPNEPELRDQWKQLCGLPVVSKRAEICFRHFKKEEVIRGKRRSKLLGRSLPSLLLDPSIGISLRRGHSAQAKAPSCVVPGCGKKKQDGVSLHRWPRLEARRNQWAILCKLKKVPKRDTVICSVHFTPSDFFVPDVPRTAKLKAKANPSLNLPNETESECGVNNAEPTHPVGVSKPLGQEDTMEPELGDNIPEECACSDGSFDSLLNGVSDAEVRGVMSVFQRLSSSLISNINGIVNSPTPSASVADVTSVASCDREEFSDCSLLNDGVRSVGTQTESRKLNLFDLIHNDTQLKAFTGVNFTNLNLLTKLVVEISAEKSEETMKNRILLTLCKLRLNVSYECLSVFVGFDRRRCGEYFASTLHLLSLVLRHTIFWPSKEEIALNMPSCFRNFRDTRVILDCTEVHLITPHCLRCKIRTYSHYKSCQTVKVLVGVAPSGLITFISQVYGGKASDKQIFEESDIIKKNLLERGIDAVMVDKGFRVDQVCDERGIKIHRPPFIVKKQALSPANARRNAEIANARVHVERIMQRLKIFQILQGKLAWSVVPFLDDIFIVIAGLVNIGPPILAEERFMTFDKV